MSKITPKVILWTSEVLINIFSKFFVRCYHVQCTCILITSCPLGTFRKWRITCIFHLGLIFMLLTTGIFWNLTFTCKTWQSITANWSKHVTFLEGISPSPSKKKMEQKLLLMKRKNGNARSCPCGKQTDHGWLMCPMHLYPPSLSPRCKLGVQCSAKFAIRHLK